MFIGRKTELEELDRRYKSNRKEFGIIYGRRRIGKSALLSRFASDKPCLFYQAKRDSAYGNLKSFSYQLDKLLSLPKNYVFSSWEEAFDSLLEAFKGRRILLIIDEYPYILKQDPSFSSVVQSFYDSATDNLMLILSGSDTSFLKDEILDHTSPLYKRSTFNMCIKKLDFFEACQFLQDLSIDERLDYLSLMSTYPYYLSAIDHSLSFESNVKRLVMNQYGIFFNLPDQLLSNTTMVQDVYNSILNAIAHRHQSIKEIAIYIHEEEAKVAKYITYLLNNELLEKKDRFMGNKRSTYYDLCDPLLKFWFNFTYEDQERIRINPDLIYKNDEEKIKLFISKGFEDVCRLYMQQLNELGIFDDVIPEFRNFKSDKTALNRSVEIDGLSVSHKDLFVMECKYRNHRFGKSMFEHLKESASIFPEKYKRRYYIFSKSGFSEDMFDLKDEVHLYTADDLFKPIES